MTESSHPASAPDGASGQKPRPASGLRSVQQREWCEDAADILRGVCAAVLQTSKGASTRLMNALLAKTAGVASVAGILGLIAAFGTASTGTAIATLSGAAATTAQLFWVGSLIGGGVLAGTVITGGLGVVIGLVGMKLITGRARKPETLSQEEQALLVLASTLAKALEEQAAMGQPVAAEHLRAVRDQGWVFAQKMTQDFVNSQTMSTLKPYHRLRLRRCAFRAAGAGKRLEKLCSENP